MTTSSCRFSNTTRTQRSRTPVDDVVVVELDDRNDWRIVSCLACDRDDDDDTLGLQLSNVTLKQ